MKCDRLESIYRMPYRSFVRCHVTDIKVLLYVDVRAQTNHELHFLPFKCVSIRT